jgi:hypothetical protein
MMGTIELTVLEEELRERCELLLILDNPDEAQQHQQR